MQAAGVHQKIAIKKSTASGAEDLRIAIEEGLTDAAAILELFPADERVRYLEAPKVWAFLIEDEFWSTLNAEANRERAITRMTFILENALHEDLLSLADIADGITFEMLATRLPHKELQKLVGHALKLGRERKPLTEEALLDSVPLQSLVGYVPLEHVWKTVVVERVAKPAGFLAGSAGNEPKAAAPVVTSPVSTSTLSSTLASLPSVSPVVAKRPSTPPPPPKEEALAEPASRPRRPSRQAAPRASRTTALRKLRRQKTTSISSFKMRSVRRQKKRRAAACSRNWPASAVCRRTTRPSRPPCCSRSNRCTPNS